MRTLAAKSAMLLLLAACSDGGPAGSTRAEVGTSGGDVDGAPDSVGDPADEDVAVDVPAEEDATPPDLGDDVPLPDDSTLEPDQDGDSGSDVTRPDVDESDTDGSGTSPGCSGELIRASQTMLPADIVIAIDASGSMYEEADLVASSMNRFATFVSASGIDYRVIMFAGATDICIPPPLSELPVCPDLPTERYVHPNVHVESNDALSLLVDRYSAYSPYLRSAAQKHILVISDDNSFMSAADFTREFSAKLSQPFVVHGIISLPNEPDYVCFGPFGSGAAPGSVYQELADQTGGVTQSICSPDWQPVFDAIAASLVTNSSVPCTFDLPGDGAGTNPGLVNLRGTREGLESRLPNVPSRDQCEGRTAWHFDDPASPRRVVLCPEACGAAFSEIRVEVGCATEK